MVALIHSLTRRTSRKNNLLKQLVIRLETRSFSSLDHATCPWPMARSLINLAYESILRNFLLVWHFATFEPGAFIAQLGFAERQLEHKMSSLELAQPSGDSFRTSCPQGGVLTSTPAYILCLTFTALAQDKRSLPRLCLAKSEFGSFAAKIHTARIRP